MLNLIDKIILSLLDKGWPDSPDAPDKPTFAVDPPDEDWEGRIPNDKSSVNVYLYEIRENTSFRRSDWDPVDVSLGSVQLAQPPAYLDCHYLISAWSKQQAGAATTPTDEEHELLAETLRILLRTPDVPRNVLDDVAGDVFDNEHIYLTLATPEGSRVLNDFWSTMKQQWRPAIPLVVTAPLELLRVQEPAERVVTIVRRFRRYNETDKQDGPVMSETIDVGGWVLEVDDTPIEKAVVTIVATGVRTTTDKRGHFVFGRIPRGAHNLRVEAEHFAARVFPLDVPDGPPAQHVLRLP